MYAEYDTQEHKVVVVGGGPCGMIAAKTLAERGMKVTLVDRQSELGGTINLAKKPPFKERMGWIPERSAAWRSFFFCKCTGKPLIYLFS